MTTMEFTLRLIFLALVLPFSLICSQLDVGSVEKTKDNNCICVPYYQCISDIAGEVVTDGRFLLDQRKINLKNGTQKCPGHFEVCCKVKRSGSKPRKAAPPYFDPSQSSVGCELDGDILSWAAALLFQKPDKVSQPAYKCGASIIHRDVVLTAAHCLEEEGYYFIKSGKSTRKLYNVIIHPEFEMGSLRHDVAVLILRKNDNDTTRSIFPCIPRAVNLLTNTECLTATYDGGTGKLEKIVMPYVDPVTCVQRLGQTRLGKFFELHDSFICAGGSERDTCLGDGGNPLVCPTPGKPGRYNQVGIVSWGIGCGQRGVPGVYVNISHVRDWIGGVMKEYGKDLE